MELETDTEPVTGTLRSESGIRTFSGWMELISGIEHAREHAQSGSELEPGEHA